MLHENADDYDLLIMDGNVDSYKANDTINEINE